MSQVEEDKFIFWKELSEMINNDDFKYIDAEKYNIDISKVVEEIYNLLMDDDIDISLYSYFRKKNEKRKAFIYEVIEDILFDKEFNPNMQLNILRNKKIIEDTLNTISVQLTYNDYEFPTFKDYSYIISEYKCTINQNDDSKSFNKIYPQQQNKLDENHNSKKLSLHMVHNSIYDELIAKGLDVWRDVKSYSLYYRIKPFEDKQKINRKSLSNYLSKLLNKNIEVYDSTEDIKYHQSDYLIISLLPMVKMDVFDPSVDLEFLHIINNMFYKNTFQYTHLLRQRYLVNPAKPIEHQQSFIVNFIRELSHNKSQADYILGWLVLFFQTLQKSKNALVLIGGEETTSILVDKIIRPIFALKQEYFSTIKYDTLKNPVETIIKDKIFYHIDDIATKNTSKNKKASSIVREILKLNPLSYTDALEQNRIYVHGQLLVTANKHNPYDFLKDSYSRCIIFKVKKLYTILNNLNIDLLTLEESIEADLTKFCNVLVNYPINTYDYNYEAYSEEKKMLQEGNFYKLIKPEVSTSDVKSFIYAIRNHKNHREYFDKIKNINSEMYDELIYNFDEDMIARQLLFEYFNIIYNEEIFSNNDEFLKILKEEDELFDQDINDNKQYKKKKRYLIPEVKTPRKRTIRKRIIKLPKKSKPIKTPLFTEKYRMLKKDKFINKTKKKAYKLLFRK